MAPSNEASEGPLERYAKGTREPAECRKCGQPVWIVYHGPSANHTTEPRTVAKGITGWAEKAEAALRQAERALAEVVRYFDSYGVPPAGFPLASVVKPALDVARSSLGSREEAR